MIVWLWMVSAVPAEAAEPLPELEARSYILMEMDSGLILAEHHAGKSYAPASLTKIMTEYLILEKIDQGQAEWDDPVRVSRNVARIGESQVYLKTGETRTVEELFSAMAIHSANDAAVALAEHFAGSEETFVSWMNRKAKEMGLEQTHFVNCTGLPRHSYPRPPEVKGEHQMSAEDIGRLSRRLLLDYPDVVDKISQPRYTFRPGEKREMVLVNRNRMVPGLSHSYQGIDGLKTGYTREAGYGFAGTAERDGMRFISVVMGTSSKQKRFTETAKLLDYGFDLYEMQKVVQADHAIPGYGKVSVDGGVDPEVGLLAEESLVLPVREGNKEHIRYQVEISGDLQAPLSAGTVVGKAKILYNGKEIPGLEPIPLVIGRDVEKAGWIRLFFRRAGDFFASLF
ncbi:D-alanyl-D-alanine carboxypeptidase family protein [Paludifilum halophilum]|uniref:D-alanyl-D-alanine carboxypeptidase family protein n=1 Tax=Paludifilum halophilum TaxID=1642702 RepID=UPI00146A2786|nr:D-alanyl-D-alanine carboxypeptidase family protein [Paludifilum halophilum]